MTADFNESRDPSLAFADSVFGLSWDDVRDGWYEIYFTRVSAGGQKLDPDLRVTWDGDISTSSSLAWADSVFGVSWTDGRDGNREIYFARLSASGAKLGDDLRVTYNANYTLNPSLAWTGSEFGVSWEDHPDPNSLIYFVRLSASGQKLGEDLRVSADSKVNTAYVPSLAWADSGFGVSWQDRRDDNFEIYFARVSASGQKLGEDLRVTTDPAASGYPSLVWTGSAFGVNWDDSRHGNDEMYLAGVADVCR